MKEKRKIVIALIILIAMDILMIPVLLFSGIQKPFPVIMFLILPAFSVIAIYFLSLNILEEKKKKLKK